MTANSMASPIPPWWERWAPPLDPPTEGGLPLAQAEAIAAAWADEPHRAAMLMWEGYAAQLPPEAPVASVTTGAQSVVYRGSEGGGEFGKATARAAWHRSLLPTLGSVPLRHGSWAPASASVSG